MPETAARESARLPEKRASASRDSAEDRVASSMVASGCHARIASIAASALAKLASFSVRSAQSRSEATREFAVITVPSPWPLHAVNLSRSLPTKRAARSCLALVARPLVAPERNDRRHQPGTPGTPQNSSSGGGTPGGRGDPLPDRHGLRFRLRDLFNKKAIERLAQIKGVPVDHKTAFICRDLTDISRYAQIPNSAHRILKEHLPGPYCFVLNATKEVPKRMQWPRKTVGIRIPDHPVAIALIAELGRPIVSSTAARHGDAPSVDPREILGEFKGIHLALDAGRGRYYSHQRHRLDSGPAGNIAPRTRAGWKGSKTD